MTSSISIAISLAYICVILSTAASPDHAPEALKMASFQAYKAAFNKVYKPEEEMDRAAAFAASVARIARRNADPENEAFFALNKYSDLSPGHFRDLFLRPPRPRETSAAALASRPPHWDGRQCSTCARFPELLRWTTKNATAEDFFLPETIDWRKKGAVTQVKSQGQCGGCYAFSATGDLEGGVFMASGKLVALSEQQIISCCSGKTHGCSGGDPGDAFKCLVSAGGVVSEAQYPYVNNESIKALRCNSAHMKGAHTAVVDSYFTISEDASQEGNVSRALVLLGPLSVSLNADSLQDYKSGVDNPSASDCPDWLLTHSMTAVGFGGGKSAVLGGTYSEVSQDGFYILKNQWGDDWGEHGYYRLKRGKNACGIATDVVHAQVSLPSNKM